MNTAVLHEQVWKRFIRMPYGHLLDYADESGGAIIPTAEDVARVKGLGFLRDKTTPDAFNARVITVGGRVTAEVMEAVAEAARRFGSGEVTLTSRMSLLIFLPCGTVLPTYGKRSLIYKIPTILSSSSS